MSLELNGVALNPPQARGISYHFSILSSSRNVHHKFQTTNHDICSTRHTPPLYRSGAGIDWICPSQKRPGPNNHHHPLYPWKCWCESKISVCLREQRPPATINITLILTGACLNRLHLKHSNLSHISVSTSLFVFMSQLVYSAFLWGCTCITKSMVII